MGRVDLESIFQYKSEQTLNIFNVLLILSRMQIQIFLVQRTFLITYRKLLYRFPVPHENWVSSQHCVQLEMQIWMVTRDRCLPAPLREGENHISSMHTNSTSRKSQVLILWPVNIHFWAKIRLKSPALQPWECCLESPQHSACSLECNHIPYIPLGRQISLRFSRTLWS